MQIHYVWKHRKDFSKTSNVRSFQHLTCWIYLAVILEETIYFPRKSEPLNDLRLCTSSESFYFISVVKWNAQIFNVRAFQSQILKLFNWQSGCHGTRLITMELASQAQLTLWPQHMGKVHAVTECTHTPNVFNASAINETICQSIGHVFNGKIEWTSKSITEQLI